MSAGRQLGFACDPAGAVILAGDRVQVVCTTCGEPVDPNVPVARTFKTGAISVFNIAGKQRHVRLGGFLLAGKDAR